MPVTVATALPTSPLLTTLISSPLSQSTFSPAIGGHASDGNIIGSAATSSNVPLLLSTLMSHSQIITSSSSTINSVVTFATASTITTQSFPGYSAPLSSTISLPILSNPNPNTGIIGGSSAFTTTIDTINTLTSSQQVPSSSVTGQTITPSVQTNPITPSTLTSMGPSVITTIIVELWETLLVLFYCSN